MAEQARHNATEVAWANDDQVLGAVVGGPLLQLALRLGARRGVVGRRPGGGSRRC